MGQTAIEWLEQAIKLYVIRCDLHKEFKQAKAMEKEQLKHAYNSDRPNLCAFTEGTAFKEYYNKTFKKKNHD